jgi:predicted outer membrane protein
MTLDHAMANDELKDFARRLNIMLPQGLSERSQRALDSLSRMRVADFDNGYA